MQKKSIIVPLLGLIGVGLIFASSGVFPDTASLPRFPTGPGTIGGVLTAFFNSDGTAKNTESLSGATASGYLQNQDCTDPLNPAWVGIDPTGKAICGNTGPLLAIGTFTELHGLVRVWHDGAPGYTVASVGESLYPGDLIESDATGTGTIAFSADNSLIRFSVDTDLELRYGDLDGLTVAEVILNDGRLWGRILSATGVNLGGGGLVTGVRGTSVDIQKTATGYIVNTVSSTRSDNSLKQIVGSTMLAGRTKGGTMSNISSYDTNTAMLSTNTNFASAVEITYDISTTPSVVKTTKNPDVFYGDAWIRDNATADIKYLSSLLAVISVGPLYTQLNNELDTTLITGNAPILMSLMTGTPMIADTMHITSAISILLEENNGDNKYNFNNLDCKKQKKTYFPGLAQCNGSWDTLAITSSGGFPGTNQTIYSKNGTWDITKSSGNEGSTNFQTGEYIKYTTNVTTIPYEKVILRTNVSSVVSSSKLYTTGTYYWLIGYNGSSIGGYIEGGKLTYGTPRSYISLDLLASGCKSFLTALNPSTYIDIELSKETVKIINPNTGLQVPNCIKMGAIDWSTMGTLSTVYIGNKNAANAHTYWDGIISQVEIKKLN